MGLVINLEGAVQEVNKASGNIETIEAINRSIEEFYKTLGVLLYIRYRKKIQTESCPANDDITNLVKDQFQKPTFDSWMRLAANCYRFFGDQNDPFVNHINRSLETQFSPTSKEIAKGVISEINNLKKIHSDNTPRKLTYGQFLEKFRELRNFRAHHWDNNSLLEPLTKSGIKQIVIDVITEIFDGLEIKLVKPVSIERDQITANSWDSTTGSFSRIQVADEVIEPKDLSQTYIVFPDETSLFGNPTDLVILEDKEDRIYVFWGMQSEHSAVYCSLPKNGGIKEIVISNINHNDIFSLSKEESDKEQIRLTQQQKFGQIRQSEAIIHNVPDLFEFYVDRPRIEKGLMDRLKHKRVFTISLSGGGGYGKTEVVKKVVLDVISNPESKEVERVWYDLVVWISAKETIFRKGHVDKITSSFHNIEDFIDCILYVTNNLQYIKQPESEKRKSVCDILNCYESTLLIIDNLETVLDKNSLWKYLDELLRDVESHIKIIITSRVDDFTYGQYMIPVGSMEDDEARRLITEQLDRYGLNAHYAHPSQIAQIANISAKSPLLIIFVVQLLARGNTLEELSKEKIDAYEQALNFICDFQWKELSDLAKDILIAVSVAQGRCSFSQVRQMCEIVDYSQFSSCKEELTQRSFVIQAELENSVIALLPPINAFIKYKLIEYPGKEEKFSTQWKILNLGVDKQITSPAGNIAFPSDVDDIQLRQLIQKAESFIRVGSITYAQQYYNKCVQFYPENAIAWRELAEFEFKYLEDDTKARSSFKKAVELDPKNPITYTKWAYWEQSRGTEQLEPKYVRDSIEYNKKALECFTDERSKRTVMDHIGSSYLRWGEIEKNLGQKSTNNEERQNHYIMADEYVKKSIKIFEDNIIDHPQDDNDLYHNAIDYNFLAVAYPRKARGDRKNAEYYYQKALVYLVKGFQAKSDYDRLLYTLGDFNLLRILKSNYQIDDPDRIKMRNQMLKICRRIEDDFDKMKLKL